MVSEWNGIVREEIGRESVTCGQFGVSGMIHQSSLYIINAKTNYQNMYSTFEIKETNMKD